MTEEKAKMSGGKKILIGLIAAFVVLTAAAYFTGVYYFSNHFLPGSMVNGLNCSYMTADEAEDLLAEQVGAYVLTVNTRNNGQESITAAQAGLVYVPDGGVPKLMETQDRYKWFLAFNQDKAYEMAASTSFDREKLQKAVKSLKCMQKQNTVEPADAYVAEGENGYEIVPESEGASLKRKQVQKLIAAAVESGKTAVSLEDEGCYKKPEIYRDNERLVKDCQQMNKLTDVIITYDFADRTETVDRSVIKEWLVRDGNSDFTLDREKVAAYVNELGYKYDTFGCTRTFTTYDGREKTIPGGDYGWAIDQSAETDGLIAAIQSGETQVREPV